MRSVKKKPPRYDSKRKKIILRSGGDPCMYAVTPDQIEGTHHFHFLMQTLIKDKP